jgi:O-antigen biosynthesis protein
MEGHVKPITRERLEYIWSILKEGPTEAGYAYFRARRRKKNKPDDELWLEESDRIPLEERGRYDLSDEDLERNHRLLDEYAVADSAEIRSIQWFIPWVPTVFLGGVYTILRFAAQFARDHGVESRFCIYDVPPDKGKRMVSGIRAAFPELANAEVTFRKPPDGGADYSHLADCDAAIATFWTSVFPVLRFARARTRFYFVQDFEPYFYPAGSAFALAEQTYRFGLPGIVNTPGLAAAYGAYGNPAVSFVPAVDLDRYHPPIGSRPNTPVRVFFYGRPASPRNAFGLGLSSLAELKYRYGDRVEIVCAGESWNPGQFGYGDVLTNFGRLRNLEEVADLYRSCHIGLVLMLTKHPSYQPFEFMASGVACVSNRNPDTAWFLRDEENCLLADPLPGAIADRIGALIDDAALRGRLVETARAEVGSVRWEDQIEGVWRAITKQDDGFGQRPPEPAKADAPAG